MANTYKNIVITPNRDTAANVVPNIRFAGGDGTSNTDINLKVYTVSNGTLSFEGSSGQLFSITNDLTGTIFSVNDISGIPSIEVDANGQINLAEFGGNIAIGKATANQKLDVKGNINANAYHLLNERAFSFGGDSSSNTNLAIGPHALANIANSGANVGVAFDPGSTEGYWVNQENIGIGYRAGANLNGQIEPVSGYGTSAPGSYNVIIGSNAAPEMYTGNENVGIGSYALYRFREGVLNTAIGAGAMAEFLNGFYNTAIGAYSLSQNRIGQFNTALGVSALASNITGNNNIGLGGNAGGNIQHGSNNVIIGKYTGDTAPISGNGNNWVVIADGIGNVRQVIDPNGNVGIGRANANYKLDVVGTINASAILVNGSPISGGGVAAATLDGANTAVGAGANNYANSTFVKLVAADQTISGNIRATSANADSIFFNNSNNYIALSNNVDTWSFVRANSVTSQDTDARDIFFKPDGTKIFVIGATNDRIYEYALSTAWDILSASFTTFFSIAQDTTPSGLYFKSDGLKFYITGSTNDTVYQYSLSSAWDISTASYDSVSFSVTTQDTAPNAVYFKDDGTIMYILGNTTNTVYQYTLGTAWDISTASYASKSLVVSTYETGCQGLWLSSDGTKIYISGTQNDRIVLFNLATPWDISTGVFNEYGHYGAIEVDNADITGLYINETLNQVYATDNSNDRIIQFSANNVAKLWGKKWAAEGDLVIKRSLTVNGVSRFIGTMRAGFITLGGGLSVTGGGFTFSSATSNFTHAGLSGNITATSLTTGQILLGGPSQNGLIRIGQSNLTHSVAIANGATVSNNTKTIVIGTEGLTGSNTIITIGSSAGTSNLTLQANVGIGRNPTSDYKLDVNGSVNASSLFINGASIPTSVNTVTINYVIDGGGSVITPGQKGHLEIPFNCTLNQWSIYLDQTGSIDIEVWKDTYANFPPTVADKINTNPYSVVSDVKAQGTQFTVTSTVTAGDILAFNVATAATATRATIALRATKT